MPSTLSPLRYPGGKTKLYDIVSNIIISNGMMGCTYIEPFAGGAGLALKLLLNNIVGNIIINDLDQGIYYFWYSVLHECDALCGMIEKTDIDLQQRLYQMQVLKNRNSHTPLQIGFATLYLNRTNRSGIISGGPIGGNAQSGCYKMNARFNKKTLIEKILRIHSVRNRVELHGVDAFDLMDYDCYKHMNSLFFNFDPPYVNKAKDLYLNFFSEREHRRLYGIISRLDHAWITTYDNVPFINNLYHDYYQQIIEVNHTAGKIKRGKEILIYSNRLKPITLEI